MSLSKSRIAASLKDWQNAVVAYKLPAWDELPSLPLYMDQVIMLLNEYLSPSGGFAQSEYAITPAMINNYVKMKIVPSPVKKRYSRAHLAYLVMVCIFKQTLNISSIPKVLPPDLSEHDIRGLYNDFVATHQQSAREYAAYVAKNAQSILEEDGASATHLVMRLAVSANFSSLLTSQLALLEEESAPAQED